MRRVFILACFLSLLTSVAGLQADQRKENIDIIVAVDKSLSMVDRIGAVKEYFNSYIVDQVTIPGDFLVVIDFYGKTEVLHSGEIQSDEDRTLVKRKISEIRANGRYTDIGGALDAIKDQFDTRASDNRKKFVLLITDGIQEAPPESKYYSKDNKFNHAFLDNAKTIQKEGWKVQVLGLGTVSAGEELSREISATYQEIPTGTTLEELKKKTSDLFGTIEAAGDLKLIPSHAKGGSAVSLDLKTRGYPAGKSVKFEVTGIRIVDPSRSVGEVLPAAWSTELPAEATTAIRIPIALPEGLPPGDSSCQVFFTFAAGERFTPTDFTATLTVPTWLQRHMLPVVLGIVAAALLLAAAVVFLIRTLRNRPVEFTVTREGKTVQGCPMKLRPRQSAYLEEQKADLLLTQKRTSYALAVFSVKAGTLSMKPLQKDRFPKLGEVPKDVRGWSFVLRSASGKTVQVEIERAERA